MAEHRPSTDEDNNNHSPVPESRCAEPVNYNKEKNDVQGTPQFMERSVNNEAECNTTPANEVRTCSGSDVKAPDCLDQKRLTGLQCVVIGKNFI